MHQVLFLLIYRRDMEGTGGGSAARWCVGHADISVAGSRWHFFEVHGRYPESILLSFVETLLQC